jgi:hypothetical protein
MCRNSARICYSVTQFFLIEPDILYVIIDPQLCGPAYLSKAYINEKITTRNGGTINQDDASSCDMRGATTIYENSISLS